MLMSLLPHKFVVTADYNIKSYGGLQRHNIHTMKISHMVQKLNGLDIHADYTVISYTF